MFVLKVYENQCNRRNGSFYAFLNSGSVKLPFISPCQDKAALDREVFRHYGNWYV